VGYFTCGLWLDPIEEKPSLSAILAREARVDSMVSRSILPTLMLQAFLPRELVTVIVALAFWLP
jgi:hypothetical protein